MELIPKLEVSVAFPAGLLHVTNTTTLFCAHAGARPAVRGGRAKVQAGGQQRPAAEQRADDTMAEPTGERAV